MKVIDGTMLVAAITEATAAKIIVLCRPRASQRLYKFTDKIEQRMASEAESPEVRGGDKRQDRSPDLSR
jgi:hypothetical protein